MKNANQESHHYAILWSPYSLLPLRSKYSPQRWVLSLTVSSLFVMLYRCPNGGDNNNNNNNLYETVHKFPASYAKFIHKLIQLLFSELLTTTTTIRHELGLDRPSPASSNNFCGPG